MYLVTYYNVWLFGECKRLCHHVNPAYYHGTLDSNPRTKSFKLLRDLKRKLPT